MPGRCWWTAQEHGARITFGFAEGRVGINFQKFARFCRQIIWVPLLHFATGEMPLFSASVKVTPCSGCAADLSVLSMHTHSSATTGKPCRTVSTTTGDLNRFTAAYILCLYRKRLLAKVIPPLPACFAERWYQSTKYKIPGRVEARKHGSISSESHKLTPRQGWHWRAGCIGHPATLPVHPTGSTFSPQHRNPPPRSAKPGHSGIRGQAPPLASETHYTGS